MLPGKRSSEGRSPGGQRPHLDRDRVLRAAVELVDREGLDALTIRRLGAELGVDAMSIYRHAASKDDLLDGLIDITLAELRLDPGAGDWRAQLHGLADQIRAAGRAHPNVFPLLLTRPLSTSLATRPRSVLRITEQILALLRDAGLDETATLSCYRRFTSWTMGRLLEELRDVVDVPEETDPALRFGLHRLPMTEFPQLRALASIMERSDHAEDELHHGLEVLIAAYK